MACAPSAKNGTSGVKATSQHSHCIVHPENWTTDEAIVVQERGVAMKGKRKVHEASFKATVALAVVKGDRTVSELSSQFVAHSTLSHA